jgi:predicted unusual protein kinase regulating ubiquinone biosynthesis (AarF/ABC1/UbiB family)
VKPTPSEELGEAFLDRREAVPTSRWGRLVRTGRSAVGLANAVLGKQNDESVDLARLLKVTSSLGELKGVAMKMGQIVSFIDPSMSAETRSLLSVLQTKAPASPWAAVEETIRTAFGARADELLQGLERRPIAVASIGQVHRAKLSDGRVVAVKVRHPGIVQAMNADFATARTGLGLANAMLFGAASSARDVVEEARRTFLAECDFRLEADHQRFFFQWLAATDAKDVVVPQVVDGWCSEAVLTTQWLAGRSFESFLASSPTQAQRDAAGLALYRCTFEALYATGRFHADPHPGNYAFHDDGRLVLYDFGCVRTYSKALTSALAALVDALKRDDAVGIRDAGLRLGFRSSLNGDEFQTFRRLTRSFFAPLFIVGPSKMTPDTGIEARALARDKRAMAALGFPPPLLFLMRIRFGLYAVLTRLGAQLDWGALESGWAAASERAR